MLPLLLPWKALCSHRTTPICQSATASLCFWWNRFQCTHPPISFSREWTVHLLHLCAHSVDDGVSNFTFTSTQIVWDTEKPLMFTVLGGFLIMTRVCGDRIKANRSRCAVEGFRLLWTGYFSPIHDFFFPFQKQGFVSDQWFQNIKILASVVSQAVWPSDWIFPLLYGWLVWSTIQKGADWWIYAQFYWSQFEEAFQTNGWQSLDIKCHSKVTCKEDRWLLLGKP